VHGEAEGGQGQEQNRTVGYDREELLAMTFSDITHPEDRARDLRGLRRLLRGEIGEYVVEKR